MAQEAFVNGAIGTLAAALTATALTFTLMAGQGTLFPTTNFVVTIDSEIVFIASRSSDTFTVASGGRGFDGSIAVAHSAGATMGQSLVAYNLNHLWQNTADTYRPDVPPVHTQLGVTGVPLGSVASSYDNEFEHQGNWILTTPPSVQTTFSIGTPMRSHLLYQTAGGDTTIATAFVPFPYAGSYTITAKLMDSVSMPTLLGHNDMVQCFFFVSDQNNPTVGTLTGNRFGVKLASNAVVLATNSNIANRLATCFQSSNGLASNVSVSTQLLPSIPLYLRIIFDGTQWAGFYGDGLTYTLLGYSDTLAMTPRTLGFQFLSNGYGYCAAIDFCRITPGQALAAYGQ